MRLLSSALSATVAVGLLAGCSGSNMSATNPTTPTVGAQSRVSHAHQIPQWSALATLIPQQFRPAGQVPKGSPARRHKAASGGIYVSEFYNTTAFNFANRNQANNPAQCTISPVSYINGQAADMSGNWIEPDGGSRSINVYAGPGACGALLGNIADPYGQPADAAAGANSAATGTFIVGNIFDTSGAGSISVCSLAGGCTANLTNSNMYEVAGVAMDKSGNCWASAINSGGTATLTYFAGCTGGGTAATGFLNSSYGGLDIDNKGNLVSIDYASSKLYVYSGCNPACTVVGGPFSLHSEVIFGHLNKQSMTFAAGSFLDGAVDVYTYNPTNVSYSYSFSNGLSASLDTEGVSYAPASEQ
jgi:hypothetical protein